jgi:hypothetical protein
MLLFIYYFYQLEHIIDKYELQNSPHLIFNVTKYGGISTPLALPHPRTVIVLDLPVVILCG